MILAESFTIKDLEKEYTINQIDEACEALRKDYSNDKNLLHDFLNFNNSEILENKINDFLGTELTHEYIADMPEEEIENLFDAFFWNICEQIDMKFLREYLSDHFDELEESVNTQKLYKAISDTADAIDDLDVDDTDKAKKDLNSAEKNITDVQVDLNKNESLTEDVDDDIEEVDLDVADTEETSNEEENNTSFENAED